MKSIRICLLLCALPLLFSCGTASEGEVQGDYRDDAAWQNDQWRQCLEECQAYLDPNVRKDEMRTLDAAYIAILSSDNDDVVPFTTDGVPCEAHIRRGENEAEIRVFRAGELVGVFTTDGDAYSGESTGIRFHADPLVAGSDEVDADIVLSVNGVTLAKLKANGPRECIEGTLELRQGISLRGSVAFSSLWETLRELTDALTEDKAVPLVEKAASDIHVKVFYRGDVSTPRGHLTMEPLHILNRYDDYWTWTPVIRANNGTRVQLEADYLSLGVTMSFYQDWKNLMPHIIK